jgi:hypothetical protein
LPTPVFASGLNFSSNHFAIKHNAFSHHKSKYSTNSYGKQKLRFYRKWNHKTKSTKKIKFPHYIYYPHWSLYGRNSLEEKERVELNINIINDKKDEQIESTVNQNKSFSPPHIVNLEDIVPPKNTKNLKTSNKQKNVILIYGTKIIETKISSE